MARASSTGVRGLYRETIKGDDGEEREAFRIDLRWREPGTGQMRRHAERLPAGTKSAEAKERCRRILNAALAGGFEPKREGPKRLSDAAKKYLEWAEKKYPRTLRDRRSLLKILQAGLGDPLLDELTPFRVERLKRDREKDGAGPATINRAVAQLKHLLGKAVEWGLVSADRADPIRKMKLEKEPAARVRYLVGDEAERLFAALPDRLRPLILTSLLTGMRKEETWSLRKSEVDLSAREITRVKTKNGKSRTIPINEALVPVLEAAMRGSTSELVFQNRHRGSRGTFRNALAKDYPAAVLRAGIANLTLHDLRHDFATRMRRGGVGIDIIAALLGHSSLAMTQRYAHIGSETLHAAVRGISLPVAFATPLPHGTDAAQGASTGKLLDFQANPAAR